MQVCCTIFFLKEKLFSLLLLIIVIVIVMLVFECSTDEKFLSLIPSDKSVHDSLRSSNQDGFHYNPSLWLQRIGNLLHPPTQYILAVDADILPCQKDFDNR